MVCPCSIIGKNPGGRNQGFNGGEANAPNSRDHPPDRSKDHILLVKNRLAGGLAIRSRFKLAGR
jgi:hypothetical protein